LDLNGAWPRGFPDFEKQNKMVQLEAVPPYETSIDRELSATLPVLICSALQTIDQELQTPVETLETPAQLRR